MSLRVDFYSGATTAFVVALDPVQLALVRASAGHPQVVAGSSLIHLGHVAADDADELLLFSFLTDLSSVGFSAEVQGIHGADVAAAAALADSTDSLVVDADAHGRARRLVDGWLSVVREAADSAAELAQPLTWVTSYDVAGSVDDGPAEQVTSWSTNDPA